MDFFVLFSLFPLHAKPGLTRPPLPLRDQAEAKMDSRCLSLLIFGIFVETSCQEGRNLRARSAKMANIAQHSAKMNQHSLQEPPKIPENLAKVMSSHRFLRFSLVLARSPPRSEKSRQDPPKSARKMPILGPMSAILATSWREVGQLSTILAPTWPILAPRCAPTGLRREPRARPNQHLGASWRQAARQEPPNLPRAYIF